MLTLQYFNVRFKLRKSVFDLNQVQFRLDYSQSQLTDDSIIGKVYIRYPEACSGGRTELKTQIWTWLDDTGAGSAFEF